MILFPAMLANCAKDAGIKLPKDVNAEDFDSEEFPHWKVYLAVQLGASLPHPRAHWENARVVAEIPDDKIREITYNQLLERGLAVGNSRSF